MRKTMDWKDSKHGFILCEHFQDFDQLSSFTSKFSNGFGCGRYMIERAWHKVVDLVGAAGWRLLGFETDLLDMALCV
jgi:hypothetical protein